MSFRVTARTLLHLGAELISSDSVALFELIKNAFDAGSPHVTIEVVVHIPYQAHRNLMQRAYLVQEQAYPQDTEALRSDFLSAIDPTAAHANSYSESVARASDIEELLELLKCSNYIAVVDSGEGMSLDTLNDVFLTIGTRSRLVSRLQRSGQDQRRPVLGEKGVGRLSAMRLGNRLHVQSTTQGEPSWNELDIDWSTFSHDSDALLEAFHVEGIRGERKTDPSESGTRLTISDLTSSWTIDKLQKLAREEFTRLTDPFTDMTLFPIQLLFNSEPVSIPRFNRLLLDNAHATVKASFARQTNNAMRLYGALRYKERQRVFSLEGPHLHSTAGTDVAVLDSLGAFDMEVYWYNRRILGALDGIGTRQDVLRLVREWGGGIMVFRDGFRVLPYGGPDDDWLKLDRRALASGGYKVNRAQLIGRLTISSAENPELTDQTNREGLRDCEEKQALVALLKHVLENELRVFLNEIDKEIKAREPVYIDELDQRVQSEEQQIRRNIDTLLKRVPAARAEQDLIGDIDRALQRLRMLMMDVREMASSFESGRGQLLNLAGIGLTVEVLAHELNRATQHVIETLAADEAMRDSQRSTMRMLDAQLRTIQRRLRVLDPLSTAGRQRKETFDLVPLIHDAIEDYADRFVRESIECTFNVEPTDRPPVFHIRAVKGMVVQVLGNLINNSVYWLQQQVLMDPNHRSRIAITLDTEAYQLTVTDNGPGIQEEMKEHVFEAFYTTKPAGQGKGLGLFIGREIARYHGADLYLAEPDNKDGICRTFVLSLEGMES